VKTKIILKFAEWSGQVDHGERCTGQEEENLAARNGKLRYDSTRGGGGA